MIANTPSPQGKWFGNTYNSSQNPANEYQRQEASRLHKPIELILRIVYRIEVIRQTMQILVYSVKVNIIQHKIHRITSQYSLSRDGLLRCGEQLHSRRGVVSTIDKQGHWAP